ncbi:amidohydrolase family protein [Haladaptatus halobius]|uniref:amidohydrolase family protein n=1 Tax=Haladaptatus halobius TaxID=2884875 RepID=UPI001D0B4E8A|nr:amidohydrolase family protein [Haladaptatus halobius]
MVLDFGAHLYPESVFPPPIADSPVRTILGDALSDLDVLTGKYTTAGVDGAVLSQPYYMGLADSDRVATANDALLDTIADADDFECYGLAAIPTAAGGDQAAAEFERCLSNGYQGGALETETDGIEVSDEPLAPIFEIANKTGAPILVHPKLSDSLHPEVLDDSLLLNATFGREIALAESVWKMIHTGVLDRYPNLTLVYHHLGGNIASMLGRIHLQLDAGRWPGQEHVKPFEEFNSQLHERIHVDTSGFFGYTQPLQTTLAEISETNILFGTDYPFEPRSADELASFVETVHAVTDDDTADRILDKNVRDLLVNVNSSST